MVSDGGIFIIVETKGLKLLFLEMDIRIEPVTPSADNARTNVSTICGWAGISRGSVGVLCSTLNNRIFYVKESIIHIV